MRGFHADNQIPVFYSNFILGSSASVSFAFRRPRAVGKVVEMDMADMAYHLDLCGSGAEGRPGQLRNL